MQKKTNSAAALPPKTGNNGQDPRKKERRKRQGEEKKIPFHPRSIAGRGRGKNEKMGGGTGINETKNCQERKMPRTERGFREQTGVDPLKKKPNGNRGRVECSNQVS